MHTSRRLEGQGGNPRTNYVAFPPVLALFLVYGIGSRRDQQDSVCWLGTVSTWSD